MEKRKLGYIFASVDSEEKQRKQEENRRIQRESAELASDRIRFKKSWPSDERSDGQENSG
jgi:hypothetical protein